MNILPLFLFFQLSTEHLVGVGKVGVSFLLLFSLVLTIDHGGGEVKKEEVDDREQVLLFICVSLFFI